MGLFGRRPLHFISQIPPAPTVGADTCGSKIEFAKLDQNFANLRDAIDKLVGEATNITEENALFAAGYRFVIRTDLITTSPVQPSIAPTSTIVMAISNNIAPTSTISMDIQ